MGTEVWLLIENMDVTRAWSDERAVLVRDLRNVVQSRILALLSLAEVHGCL